MVAYAVGYLAEMFWVSEGIFEFLWLIVCQTSCQRMICLLSESLSDLSLTLVDIFLYAMSIYACSCHKNSLLSVLTDKEM